MGLAMRWLAAAPKDWLSNAALQLAACWFWQHVNGQHDVRRLSGGQPVACMTSCHAQMLCDDVTLTAPVCAVLDLAPVLFLGYACN